MMSTSTRVRALFDTPRFWADIERVRLQRSMSWKQLCGETGLPLSLRTERSDNPRIDTLVPLAIWAGLSLTSYIQVFNTAGQRQEAQEPRFSPGRPPGYDIERFYRDLDQVREQRGATWTYVWRHAPSTAVPLALPAFICDRIPMSERACLALAQWAGLDFASYRQ